MKREEEKKELLTISLTTVLILAAITLFITWNESGFTGHAIQSISFLQAGNDFSMEVDEIKGLKQISFQTIGDVKNSQIVIEENKDIEFDGVAYSKFTMSSDDADKFGVMTFILKIKQKELRSASLTPEEVHVYVDGKEMETRIDHTEGDYEFYTATITEVGEMVIGMAFVEEVKEPIIPPQLSRKTVAPPIIEDEPLPPVEQQPAPPKKVGFFGKIINFFKGLFG